MFQPRAALHNRLGCRQQPPNLPFCDCLVVGTFDVFCRPQSRTPAARASTNSGARTRINGVVTPVRFLGRTVSLRPSPRGALNCSTRRHREEMPTASKVTRSMHILASGPDHAKWPSFALRVQPLAAVAPQLALQRQHRHTHDFSEREASVWGRQRGCTHPKLGFMSISTLQAF